MPLPHRYRCDRVEGNFRLAQKIGRLFFAHLDGLKPIAIKSPSSVGELKKCLEEFDVLERILDEYEEGLTVCTVLLAYYHWASVGLIPGAVLASNLALLLKRCIVPSIPRKCLTSILILLFCWLAKDHWVYS